MRHFRYTDDTRQRRGEMIGEDSDDTPFPLPLEKYGKILGMRIFPKAVAASLAAALLTISTPQAEAFVNYYPTLPNSTEKHIYHFDDGKPAISVDILEDGDGARILADNNSDGSLQCEYWYGPEEAIRPGYNVVLYGDPADRGKHSTELREVIQTSDRIRDVRGFFVTHYTPGNHWAETISYRDVDLQGEPLAILAECSSGPFPKETSFNYTVVDQQGNKLPHLIPDAAAVRAGLDFSEPRSPADSSSLSGSSF